MMRSFVLLVTLILAIAPAGMWANGIVHLQTPSHQSAEAADHDHAAGDAKDQHDGYHPVGGCSAMPGHCMAEVIVPGASHFDTVRIVLIRFPIHAHDPRIGIPVSADPPPPRA